MDLADVLRRRKMVRNYTDEPVPRETIERIVAHGTEIEWPVPWWYVDAGKATMLLLLAAIDEGLGAGLFGLDPAGNDRLGKLLGIPDDVAVVGVVTVGHAAPDPRSGSRKRGWKPLEEVVRWERW